MFKIERVKNAAQRLADYIGLKHKIRIKQSTALEAMARMEGFNSWNDYAAKLNEPEPVIQVVKPNGWVMRPLMYRFNAPDIQIRQHELVRHVLALGPQEKQRQWALWQLNEHVRNGVKGVFFDVFDVEAAQLSEDEIKELHTLFDIVDFDVDTVDTIFDKCMVPTKPVLINPRNSQERLVGTEGVHRYLSYRAGSGIQSVYATGSKEGDLRSEPFNICVFNFHNYDQFMDEWAAQARAFNVALLFTADGVADSNSKFKYRIDVNLYRTLYLDITQKQAQDALAKRLSAATCFIDTNDGFEII